MNNFKLKGELDLLSDKQIDFVCSVLKKRGFEGSEVLIGTLGKAGDNYGSDVKTITVEHKDGKTLKIIAKVAPTLEHVRSTMATEILFGNECIMYSKVLPKFRDLEIDADIPKEDRSKFPICYGILNEPLHEIILLEDLREYNYAMRDRLKSLTDEEIRIILNSFAKLHSLSFVLKTKDPAKFKEYTSQLNDFFTSSQMEENGKKGFHIMESSLISLFDADRYKDKIRGTLTNITNEARKLRRCDAGSKYSIIVHGDSWTNNILLKLNDATGIPEESMLIDYQLSCERSPVSDLLYLILNCTDYDTRSKHYDEWMDEYHEKLDRYLSNHGIKANYVYPREKMLADLKRYSKSFLGWSLLMANTLCMDTEGASRLKDAMNTSDGIEEIIENYGTELTGSSRETLLKEKVRGLIDSYYELGYCY